MAKDYKADQAQRCDRVARIKREIARRFAEKSERARDAETKRVYAANAAEETAQAERWERDAAEWRALAANGQAVSP